MAELDDIGQEIAQLQRCVCVCSICVTEGHEGFWGINLGHLQCPWAKVGARFLGEVPLGRQRWRQLAPGADPPDRLIFERFSCEACAPSVVGCGQFLHPSLCFPSCS